MNQKKNEEKMLDTGLLQDSIKSLFTTLYLTATAMNAFSRLLSPSPIDAIFSESQNRLFIVSWIAILTMLVLLISNVEISGLKRRGVSMEMAEKQNNEL